MRQHPDPDPNDDEDDDRVAELPASREDTVAASASSRERL